MPAPRHVVPGRPPFRLLGRTFEVPPDIPVPLLGEDGRVAECPSGDACPEHLGDVFASAELAKAAAACRFLTRFADKVRGSWNPFVPEVLHEILGRCHTLFKGAIPYGVCPSCQGEDTEGVSCAYCMGQGWVPFSMRELPE